MTYLNTASCHNCPHLDESILSCPATTQQQFFRQKTTRERLSHSDGISTVNLLKCERLFCWEAKNSVTWGIIMHHSFPCNLTLSNKSIIYSLVYWTDLQHFKWKDDFLLFFSRWHQQIQSVHLVTWHCCRQSNAEKSAKRSWHREQQPRNREASPEPQDRALHSCCPQEKPPATRRQGRTTQTWGSHPLLRLCGLAPSHRGWSPIGQREFASSCAKTLSSETTFFLKLEVSLCCLGMDRRR